MNTAIITNKLEIMPEQLQQQVADYIDFLMQKHHIENSSSKQEILGDLKQAVEELKLVKAGKLKPITAKQLLDEL